MFEGSCCQMFSGHKQNFSNNYCFGMVLAWDPWHSSVVYVDAEAFDIRLRATSKFLLFHLLHMNWDVSAYQSTGQCLYLSLLNFISQHHFLICMYSSVHVKKTKIMNCDKEIYVLKFTVVCHVIHLLLAVLQCDVCPGFQRTWNFSITSHAVWVFNCGPSTKNACIKGVLL